MEALEVLITGNDFSIFSASSECKHLGLVIGLLKILSEVLSLCFHVIDEVLASWVLVHVVSGIVLHTIVDEQVFLVLGCHQQYY